MAGQACPGLSTVWPNGLVSMSVVAQPPLGVGEYRKGPAWARFLFHSHSSLWYWGRKGQDGPYSPPNREMRKVASPHFYQQHKEKSLFCSSFYFIFF